MGLLWRDGGDATIPQCEHAIAERATNICERVYQSTSIPMLTGRPSAGPARLQ
jgi:hypothetical protein